MPEHPKKLSCVECGCQVGPKAVANVKKAHGVGVERVLELWLTQSLVVHPNDHKICSKCKTSPIEVPFIFSSQSNELWTLIDFNEFFSQKKKG